MGGTILQNTLRRRLPAAFTVALPDGVQIAYSAIPNIAALPEPLRTQVRIAFAESTQLIWHVMIGVSALGLFSCLLMQEVVMRTNLDESWGLVDDAVPKREPAFEMVAIPPPRAKQSLDK